MSEPFESIPLDSLRPNDHMPTYRAFVEGRFPVLMPLIVIAETYRAAEGYLAVDRTDNRRARDPETFVIARDPETFVIVRAGDAQKVRGAGLKSDTVVAYVTLYRGIHSNVLREVETCLGWKLP